MNVWFYFNDNRGKKVEVPEAESVDDAIAKAKEKLNEFDRNQIDHCTVDEDFI